MQYEANSIALNKKEEKLMYRCCNKNCCCCMQNNCNLETNPALETICNDVPNYNTCGCNDMFNKCQCGFDEEESVFPSNPMLGQSYVPIQMMTNTFTPCCGLKNGTIFPELVSPYYPCQSIEDIEYIRSRNTIGKGCNTCS